MPDKIKIIIQCWEKKLGNVGKTMLGKKEKLSVPKGIFELI